MRCVVHQGYVWIAIPPLLNNDSSIRRRRDAIETIKEEEEGRNKASIEEDYLARFRETDIDNEHVITTARVKQLRRGEMNSNERDTFWISNRGIIH